MARRLLLLAALFLFRPLCFVPANVTVFLDCDDCLYQNQWATAEKLTKSISSYTQRLGVSASRAFGLYEAYGTCLKGLLAEGILDRQGAEAAL